MIENDPTTTPTATSGLNGNVEPVAKLFAKFGKMGITTPKPRRSMKMVKNRINIRLSFMCEFQFWGNPRISQRQCQTTLFQIPQVTRKHIDT